MTRESIILRGYPPAVSYVGFARFERFFPFHSVRWGSNRSIRNIAAAARRTVPGRLPSFHRYAAVRRCWRRDWVPRPRLCLAPCGRRAGPVRACAGRCSSVPWKSWRLRVTCEAVPEILRPPASSSFRLPTVASTPKTCRRVTTGLRKSRSSTGEASLFETNA